jgi:hypothetical protein
VYEGSPIANLKLPSWLGWIVMVLYTAGALYVIYNSATYAISVLTGLGAVSSDPLLWGSAGLMSVLSVVNAVMLAWVAYYVGSRLVKNVVMPVVTAAGLIFLFFLDWLLIEWLWDPHVAPFAAPGTYGIGWANVNSMLFMVVMYLLAAAIFYGFNAYRKSQGIDIDKVYQEIPVE